jgi:hypothetical protein
VVWNLGLLGSVSILGYTLTTPDGISILSADLLLVLILVTVLPLKEEPDMEFESHPELHHTFTIKHPHGEFKMRMLYVGVLNKTGILAKAAHAVKVSISVGFPYVDHPSAFALPWQFSPHEEIRLKETVDPTSPESVCDALNKSVFSKRRMDFDPGDAYLAIVAFGLEKADGIWAATEIPVKLNITLRSSRDGKVIPDFLIGLPVSLRLSSPDLSTPPSSGNFIITGKNWQDAKINEVGIGKTTRVKESQPPQASSSSSSPPAG